MNKNAVAEFAENPMTVYCHFLYRHIGRPMLQKPGFNAFFYKNVYNRRYEGILRQANLRMLPEEYFISIFLTFVGTSILVFLTSIFLLFFTSGGFSALTFYIGMGAIMGVGIFMYNYPVVVAKDRGSQIDASIPYVLPYMKILGKELTLSKIVRIIDDFIIYKEMQIEFKRIKYYSDFLGYDIHSSIKEAMSSCPSKNLADLMNDMVTISNSGGDIYSYLDRKLTNLNAEIEALEKKNIDTLLILSQVYVVILLISPLFFTIMTSILNLVDFTADSGMGTGGDSVLSIIILLVVLPFAYVGFMMLVLYSKPLYARLKPIKDE